MWAVDAAAIENAGTLLGGMLRGDGSERGHPLTCFKPVRHHLFVTASQISRQPKDAADIDLSIRAIYLSTSSSLRSTSWLIHLVSISPFVSYCKGDHTLERHPKPPHHPALFLIAHVVSRALKTI